MWIKESPSKSISFLVVPFTMKVDLIRQTRNLWLKSLSHPKSPNLSCFLDFKRVLSKLEHQTNN